MKETKHLHCDILCLPEMHFSSKSPPLVSNSHFPHIYYSKAITKKRGVLIAIKDTISFKLVSQIQDKQGHYLALVCEIINIVYTFINLYLPNVRTLT